MRPATFIYKPSLCKPEPFIYRSWAPWAPTICAVGAARGPGTELLQVDLAEELNHGVVVTGDRLRGRRPAGDVAAQPPANCRPWDGQGRRHYCQDYHRWCTNNLSWNRHIYIYGRLSKIIHRQNLGIYLTRHVRFLASLALLMECVQCNARCSCGVSFDGLDETTTMCMAIHACVYKRGQGL